MKKILPLLFLLPFLTANAGVNTKIISFNAHQNNSGDSTLTWTASEKTDARIEVNCPVNIYGDQIKFYVLESKKTVTCGEKILANFIDLDTGAITIKGVENKNAVQVQFSIIILNNGTPTSESKSLSITFQPATTSATPVSGLTETQIQAILSLLASFNADQVVITSVSNALKGITTASVPLSNQCVDLKIDLKFGMKNEDVYKLQIFLKAKGYLSSDATGYFGSLTSAAVKKFQTDISISVTGNAGPITRAKIKSISCI